MVDSIVHVMAMEAPVHEWQMIRRSFKVLLSLVFMVFLVFLIPGKCYKLFLGVHVQEFMGITVSMPSCTEW